MIPHTLEAKPRLLDSFRLSAIISGSIVFFYCLAVTVGWYCDIHALKMLFGFAVPFGAAVSYMVLSCLVLLLAVFPDRKDVRYICSCVSLLAALTGAFKLLESIQEADWDWFNIPLSGELANGVILQLPGQVTPDGIIGILLVSSSLFLMTLHNSKLDPIWQILLTATGAVALLPVVGFLQGIPEFCGLWGCIKVPVTLAASTLILSFAVYSLRPGSGWFSLLLEPDMLGTALRRSLFALMVLLPAFTGLKAGAVAAHVIDENTASPALSVLNLLSAVSIVIWQFVYAYRREQELRRETEKKLADLSSEMSSGTKSGATPTNIAGYSPRYAVCPVCAKQLAATVSHCPDDGSAMKIVDKLEGQILDGKYKIVEYLGAGGMSTVYKARHIVLDKILALKLLQPHLLGNARFVQRFQREAQAMARMQHPNLLTVHECGFLEGVPFLLLDFIDGKSLDVVIRERSRLSVGQMIVIILQVADGLINAHDNGVVHRDIKPANIMISENVKGRELVKVVDFGLAKMLESEQSMMQQKVSREGNSAGSPMYMSPEQCVGDPADARTDLYALGCVMYECLTGNPPLFGQTILDTFNKVMNEKPQPVSMTVEIPQELDDLILKCLEKKPDDRPASVLEFRTALKEIKERMAGARRAANLA
ncbi:MAG: serine/threonine protein kinase [Candidatus Obscuribacterales bacterium]|nr:serine/threonine protein kinase [Candidatus Obscuribacterales bacterium]